ncbi:MAG: patatin family protein [Clostridia bacterium]
MNKVGLILEGGGMRGLYTSGVLDFFIENNIEFEEVVGVSAGSANGASYISKQNRRNYDINLTYANDKNYLSFRNFIKTGSVFNMDMLFNKIPEKLFPYDYNAFNNSNTNFVVVATNCDTGKPEYIKIKDMKKDVLYLQASCSMPLVSKIVEVDGLKLLDGGISDSIPVEYLLSKGFDKCVVIKTRDRNYIKGTNKTMRIVRRKYKKYPNLINTIENRYKVYNETCKKIYELEKIGKVFVIEPKSTIKVSQIEKDKVKLHDLYTQGYNNAKECFNDLLQFIK